MNRNPLAFVTLPIATAGLTASLALTEPPAMFKIELPATLPIITGLTELLITPVAFTVTVPPLTAVVPV